MSWFPIFGSSPDAITPQIFNFAAADRSVKEANIARANAAEQQRNSYFANVAQMRRANTGMENQMALDERSRAEYAELNAERRKEQKYQFSADLDFRKKDLEARVKDAADRVKIVQQEEADKIKTAAEKLKLANESLAQKQESGLNAAYLAWANHKDNIVARDNPPDDVIAQIMEAVKNKTGPLDPSLKFDSYAKRFKKQSHVTLGRPPPDTYNFSSTGTTPPPEMMPSAPVVNPLAAAPRPLATPLPRGGGTMMDFSERPISTQAEYEMLPPNARFVWTYPDGRKRRGRKP